MRFHRGACHVRFGDSSSQGPRHIKVHRCTTHLPASAHWCVFVTAYLSNGQSRGRRLLINKTENQAADAGDDCSCWTQWAVRGTQHCGQNTPFALTTINVGTSKRGSVCTPYCKCASKDGDSLNALKGSLQRSMMRQTHFPACAGMRYSVLRYREHPRRIAACCASAFGTCYWRWTMAQDVASY